MGGGADGGGGDRGVAQHRVRRIGRDNHTHDLTPHRAHAYDRLFGIFGKYAYIGQVQLLLAGRGLC